MKLITETYDDYEILIEGKGKDMKIQGVFMQQKPKIVMVEYIPLAFFRKK